MTDKKRHLDPDGFLVPVPPRARPEPSAPPPSNEICDCNDCRLARGAFSFSNGSHDVCKNRPTPAAPPTPAPSGAQQWLRENYPNHSASQEGIDLLDAYAAARVRELQPAMKALYDLTPVGSEFVSDIDRCVAHIRERFSTYRSLVDAVKARQSAEADATRLREVLTEILDRFPSPSIIEELKADAGYGYRPCVIDPVPRDSDIVRWRAVLTPTKVNPTETVNE